MLAARPGRTASRPTWIATICAALLVAVAAVAAVASSPASPPPSRPLTDLIRKQPYLIWPGDNAKMEVLWQLTSTATAEIDWGVDTTYALGSAPTTEYGSDHQHRYTITGLVPGQRYCYRVIAGGPAYAGTFRAAPPATATAVKFFDYGDNRTNTSIHNQVAGLMMADAAADPGYQSLVLDGGDLTANGDQESSWTNEIFNPTYTNIRAMMANEPFHAAMGNHEGAGTIFVKYFPYPFVGGRYWSYDYGPMHIAVLDQYTSYAPGSAQLLWLAADLAASTKPWKFVMLHEPGWSAGGGHENNIQVQNYIQPLCLQYGVEMVLGGHNHYYARAEVNGIEHITSGGGGAPLYTPSPSYPNIVTCSRSYHYCRVAIDGGTLTFVAVSTAGAVLDSFQLHAQETSVPAQTAQASLGRAWPNPFTTGTVIDWRSPAGAPADLLILDVSGRRIRRFSAPGTGVNSAVWDGKDADGRPVAPGVYYYRLDPPRGTPPGKVTLVR